MAQKWHEKGALDKGISILGMLVILAGFAVGLYMNFVINRTLWLDEALLVKNIMTRSLAELCASSLDNLQAAPALYLYIVKILTLIFDTSEPVLRLWSLFSYMVTVILTVYAGKRLLNLRFPILAGAMIANMKYMLNYSNQFKQYMNECMWVLIVLILFDIYLRRNKSWSAWGAMMAVYFIAILSANPAAFAIGAVLLTEMAFALASKDWESFKKALLGGVVTGSFFAGYYFLFLRYGNSDGMQAYWQESFLAIPTNAEMLEKKLRLINAAFRGLGSIPVRYGILLLALISLLRLWKDKNRTGIAIWVILCLAAAASFFHFFPMEDRLWLFSYPLLGLLAFYSLEYLAAKVVRLPDIQTKCLAVLCCLMIFLQTGIIKYMQAENVYFNTEEIKPLVAYLEENVQEGDKVWVYAFTNAPLQYLIGYDTNRIGNAAEDNIIWSVGTAGNEDNLETDLSNIAATDGCFLLTSFTYSHYDEYLAPLLEALDSYGEVSKALVAHGTVLYYWEPDEE